MTAAVFLPPLVRALATAFLVVGASAAAEALGPIWGAVIASLPVSAGPTYVFLAMQHGDDFIAASALGSFAANAAIGLFLIIYSILARRTSGSLALGVATLAWLAVSAAMAQVAWTPLTALLMNLAVFAVGFVLPTAQRGAVVSPRVRQRWGTVVVRGAAVAGFVSLVVAASAALGPRVTGIAAMFPVTFICLFVIVRPRIGGAAAAFLAANALRAMLGFGMMMLTLHVAVRPLGAAPALVVALLVSVLWSGALLARQHRAVAAPDRAAADQDGATAPSRPERVG